MGNLHRLEEPKRLGSLYEVQEVSTGGVEKEKGADETRVVFARSTRYIPTLPVRVVYPSFALVSFHLTRFLENFPGPIPSRLSSNLFRTDAIFQGCVW